MVDYSMLNEMAGFFVLAFSIGLFVAFGAVFLYHETIRKAKREAKREARDTVDDRIDGSSHTFKNAVRESLDDSRTERKIREIAE